jgi:hypothetical protein
MMLPRARAYHQTQPRAYCAMLTSPNALALQADRDS